MDQIIKTVTPIAAALAIIAFALPSYLSVVRQRGTKGLVLLLATGVYLLLMLGLLAKISLPVIGFSFSSSLGYKILGVVPWTIAFAYPPILLAGFWLANKISRGFLGVLLTAFFALIINVAIDPALGRLTLWHWENPGSFYGVPILGFLAWFVVWLVGAFIVSKIWDPEEEAPKRGAAFSGFLILWFWSGVNFGLQHWVPGAIGVVLGVAMFVMMFIEKRRDQKES